MSNAGKLIWQIACDESGVGGAKYYGFGSLWMRWQRRGDLSKDISELRAKYHYKDEIKWQKAHTKKYQDFYIELIEYFFKKHWLAFHCLIVRKGMVNKDFHDGDYDLARRKHFTMLLSSKIKHVIKAHPKRQCSFRILVDPIASRYKKADEESHVITNNEINKSLKLPGVVESYITRDSKLSFQIQLSDLLLGAIMDAWQKKSSSEGKQLIQTKIAAYLGWDNLEADTFNTERKLNIWYFHDTKFGPKEAITRKVNLKYPLPKL